MRDASCTVALRFGPLSVVVRVAVQRKLREVFGSRDSAGSSAGCWALSEEVAGVFCITTALRLYPLDRHKEVGAIQADIIALLNF